SPESVVSNATTAATPPRHARSREHSTTPARAVRRSSWSRRGNATGSARRAWVRLTCGARRTRSSAWPITCTPVVLPATTRGPSSPTTTPRGTWPRCWRGLNATAPSLCRRPPIAATLPRLRGHSVRRSLGGDADTPMRPAKLTAILTAAALLAAGALGASEAFASHNETVFFEAPGDLINVPSVRQAKTLGQLESLGVRALRVTLFWRSVAPRPNHRNRPRFNQASPAAYNWGSYDSVILKAVARHWKVLLTVSGPVPQWATPHGADKYSYPNTTDFRQFMQAVGRHYGKLVKLFSIWNEPNQPGFLRPQYVRGTLTSPAIYRGLFLAGYRGLQASGHFAGMRVLMGETSAVGAKLSVAAPLAFLRGVLCLDASYRPIGHCSKLPADGYAQHPYENSHGPFGAPPA